MDNWSQAAAMEHGEDQTTGELLQYSSGMKLPDEAANHGDGRGEEGTEAEEMNHKGEGTDQSVGSGGKMREDVGGRQCSGIINHLMTNLMPGSSAGESEQQKKQQEDQDSCGLIDHLISSLPINPDGETPAADEASLLISIIED